MAAPTTEQAITATESIRRVRESAESIRNDQLQKFPEAASVGEMFRQGDLYIQKLDFTVLDREKPNFEAYELDPQPIAQLAPGTTKGSRHILSDLSRVKMFKAQRPTALDGPVIYVLGGGVEVTHPEHGNVHLPSGVYGITYQRAFGDELRRVAD